jgi:hypothetical protein
MSKYPHDPLIRGSFFKKEYWNLVIALLRSEADMRKSRQENDLNSGFCSNSFTFSLSSSIFLSKLGGTITPIFKAENPKLPQNYRGITICNSIGKVFNSILNNRLDNFLIENDIIHENQIGFSKKSRTSDHIFVLKCIFRKVSKNRYKKVICVLCGLP